MTDARTYARPLDAVDTLRARTTDRGWSLRVRKTVRESDPYMAGHFPGLILYPAVFLLETVRQAVAEVTKDTWGGWLEIAGIRQLRLIRPMLDGGDLDFDIEVVPEDRADAVVLVAKVGVRHGETAVAELTAELERGGRS